jgi:hypothetical protein
MLKGEMLFVIGEPGCGKSTFYHTCFPEHTLLDSDVLTREHPEHKSLCSNSTGQTKLHEFGKEKREAAFKKALNTYGQNYYYSTSGGSTVVSKINNAKEQGFFVRVIELKADGDVDPGDNNQLRVRVLGKAALLRAKISKEDMLPNARKLADSYQVVYNDACNWMFKVQQQ